MEKHDVYIYVYIYMYIYIYLCVPKFPRMGYAHVDHLWAKFWEVFHSWSIWDLYICRYDICGYMYMTNHHHGGVGRIWKCRTITNQGGRAEIRHSPSTVLQH